MRNANALLSDRSSGARRKAARHQQAPAGGGEFLELDGVNAAAVILSDAADAIPSCVRPVTLRGFQTHARGRRDEDQPTPWQTMSLRKEFGQTETPRELRFRKDPEGS